MAYLPVLPEPVSSGRVFVGVVACYGWRSFGARSTPSRRFSTADEAAIRRPVAPHYYRRREPGTPNGAGRGSADGRRALPSSRFPHAHRAAVRVARGGLGRGRRPAREPRVG